MVILSNKPDNYQMCCYPLVPPDKLSLQIASLFAGWSCGCILIFNRTLIVRISSGLLKSCIPPKKKFVSLKLLGMINPYHISQFTT